MIANLTNASLGALIVLLCLTIPVTIAAFLAEQLEKRRKRTFQDHGRERLGMDRRR